MVVSQMSLAAQAAVKDDLLWKASKDVMRHLGTRKKEALVSLTWKTCEDRRTRTVIIDLAVMVRDADPANGSNNDLASVVRQYAQALADDDHAANSLMDKMLELANG